MPKQLEQMSYVPTIKLCLCTRGTLQSGKPSRACVWTTMELRQWSQDRRYYFGRDTYDHQNPFIYQRHHLQAHADYYRRLLNMVIVNHFSDLAKCCKQKRLQAPIKTELREFDTIKGRHVFYTFDGFDTPTNIETLWQRIIDKQAVV